jgi:hypothetical protein
VQTELHAIFVQGGISLVSIGEDIIFLAKTSISLTLKSATLSLPVLRAAIGAPMYLNHFAVVTLGIYSSRKRKHLSK